MSDEFDIKYPHLSTDLIDWLDKTVPARCRRKAESAEDHYWHSAQRALVDQLIAFRDDANALTSS